MTKRNYEPSFIISAWCGPEATVERYREYADCGFNLLLGGDAALAKAVGLKAIVGGGPADVEKYAGDPAVVGTFLADEPQTSKFEELGKLCDAVRKANPRSIPYINLLPTYASQEQLGSPTYEEHVRKYIGICKPPFVSWDHYALYGSCERPDYFENLEIVSRLCREAGIPFVQIILSVPHFAYRDPNEADLRWQVYTTLAYGSKGIIYFTYITPPDGGFYRNAIITEAGKRSEKYEYVKRLNGKLKVLAPLLVELDGVRVVHTDPVPLCASGLDGNFPATGAEGMPMTIGWLKDSGKCDYLWVVNRSFDYQKGMVRSWELSDLYTAAGKTIKELQDMPFEPETTEGQAGCWPTVGVRVSGKADLLCLRSPPPYSTVYLRTSVRSAVQQDAVIELSTSTDTKVWFNDEVVFEIGPGDLVNKVRVRLKSGSNTLLVKMTRSDGHMNIAARFVSQEGGAMDRVELDRDHRQQRDRAEGRVVLRDSVRNVVEISQETGEPVDASYDARCKVLAVSLEPGEGRLYRLEADDASMGSEEKKTGTLTTCGASAANDLRLDLNSGISLEADRNGMPAGTELFATHSCLDYSLATLVDGIRDRSGLGWLGCSWASTEDSYPHGIEIRLSKPLKGGAFRVTWALENGTQWFVSRRYFVQVRKKARGEWKTVAEVRDNQAKVSDHALPDEPFSFLRICQESGGGSLARPNIMWVGQIELTGGRTV